MKEIWKLNIDEYKKIIFGNKSTVCKREKIEKKMCVNIILDFILEPEVNKIIKQNIRSFCSLIFIGSLV